MSSKKLTKKQLALMHTIDELSMQNGAPPTIVELKTSMGLKSDQSIYQLLEKLVTAGVVERQPGKRRSIRLVRKSGTTISSNKSKTFTANTSSMPYFEMDAVQKEIFNRLHDIDSFVANIYKGALFTMTQKDYHPDWIAQVANSLRHIFGILTRDDGESKVKDNKDGSGIEKISNAFDPQGNIVRVKKSPWKEWNDLNEFFTKVSHYNSGYQKIEDEFIEKIQEFSDLLIRYILPDQVDIYENIDNLIKNIGKDIDSDDLDKCLRNTAAYSYFFDNIGSKWFDFLKENNYLAPTVQVGQYLVRIASEVSEKIVDLVKRYEIEYKVKKEDIFIRHFFISAATNMPSNQASKIVSILVNQKWIKDSNYSHDSLFYEGEKLLKNLIKNKDFNTANLLVSELLSVRQKKGENGPTDDVEAYVDNYFYNQIINDLKVITPSKLEPFVKTLISLLEKTIDLSSKDEEFVIWRYHVGQRKDYYRVTDMIINGIIDLSTIMLNIAKKNSDDISSAIDKLLSGCDLVIAIRIKLFLYAKFSSYCKDEIQWAIIEYLQNEDVEYEYNDLVRQEFCNIDKKFQDKIFELINKGPINRAKDDEYVRYWKLGKYVLVQDCLTKKWDKAFKDLLGDDKASRYELSSGSGITSWSGPTAPIDSTSLESMSIDQVIEYLNEWTPKKGFGEPSRIGLGRKLSDVIKKNPLPFSEMALKFNTVNLHPVYLYELFFGLREAVRSKLEIKWEPVIDLMKILVDKDQAGDLIDGSDDDDDWNVGWNDVFQYVAGLLENGMVIAKNEIPFELRDKVWSIIDHIRKNKEPNPKYEKEYGGSNSDQYSLSINTARGEAFHALFNYIFWYDRNTKKKTSLDRVPMEAKKVLEEHLEIYIESGLVIRSVYGRFFQWLYVYDKIWAKTIINKLFPLDDLSRRYAAWETYLLGAVYPEVFEALRPQYSIAIEELKKSSLKKDKRSIDPFERLIDHLVISYVYGIIKYDDDLFIKFYKEANREQKGMAISFVGRSYIYGEVAGSNLPDKNKIKKFWELRIKESINVSEIKEFGWWVKAGYFDDKWMLSQLLKTLEITKGVISEEFRVLKSLRDLLEDHALLVANCLLKIVKSKNPDHFLKMTRTEHVSYIVSRLYRHPDIKIRVIMSRISDQMLKLGVNDFRTYTQVLSDEDIEPKYDIVKDINKK